MSDPYTHALLLARQLAEVDINSPEEDLEFPPPQIGLPGLAGVRHWLGRRLIRLGQSLDTFATASSKSSTKSPSSEIPC